MRYSLTTVQLLPLHTPVMRVVARAGTREGDEALRKVDMSVRAEQACPQMAYEAEPCRNDTRELRNDISVVPLSRQWVRQWVRMWKLRRATE